MCATLWAGLRVQISMEDKQFILNTLRKVVPANILLHREEELKPYECDGLSVYRQIPLLVAIPRSLEQLKSILITCSKYRYPVVARGAGTGLSGGALPLANGVLISLTKFNRIISIDPERCTARVQPGVRNLQISQAVKAFGLFYAPDPSSQIACSIGGNVAENSGGVHCLKYGLTVHNIQSITVMTMEGDTLRLGGAGLDSPGFDLLALMTGSEGLLGIIVDITVKLLPLPPTRQVMLAAFDKLTNAADTVASIIAAGIIPAGLEFMDQLAIKAAEAFVKVGYPVDAEAILICEVDGVAEDVNQQTKAIRAICKQHHMSSIRVAEDELQAEAIWQGRKAAFPAVGAMAPDYYCMDGSIPRKQLANVLQQIAALSQQYGLAIANVFHAGDGNLHPLILYDANKPGELDKTEELGGKILQLCVDVGGSITGEHGVGVEKLDQMCVQFGAKELQQFHEIKSAFDPDGLLNPGKAVPTLHRCAEFGAMHVHQGKLPFPELERF